MTKPTRSAARSFRSALVPAAMLAAFAAASLGGEREASAMLSSVASKLVGDLVLNTISCAANGTSDWAKCLLTGQAGGATLSSEDISSIKDALATELDAYELDTLADGVKTLVTLSSAYSRVVTTEASSSYEEANDIWSKAVYLCDQLEDHGLSGSSSYAVASAVRVAFALEKYEVMVGVNQSTGQNIYKPNNTSTAMSTILSDAVAVGGQLNTFAGLVDSAVGSVVRTRTVVDARSEECNGNPSMWSDRRGDKLRITYCFSNPMVSGGETCYKYYSCETNAGTAWPRYSTTEDNRYWAKAKIHQQQARMAYRALTVGSGVYEQIEGVNQIASGKFEYCGNGLCGIAETDPASGCTADCTAGSDYSTISVAATDTSWSSAQTILQNDLARLVWSGSTLRLEDLSGNLIWQSSASGTRLYFQQDGNLTIRNSSGQVWATNTYWGNKAYKMVLLGKALYLLGETGNTLWSTTTDFNAVATRHDTFCYDNSQTRTLLSNGVARVDWQSDGNLVIYNASNAAQWSTSTASTGKYLCMQEDGNLVLYSDQYSALWHSNTDSSNFYGAHLSLVGTQLRLLDGVGSVVWASGSSNWASSGDGNVSTISMAGACYSTNREIFRTNNASLAFDASGNLILYTHNSLSSSSGYNGKWVISPGNSSGSSNRFCLQGDGNAVLYSGTGAALWASNTSTSGSPGGKFVLAGCNLMVQQGTNSKTVWATDTNCD